MVGFEVHGIAGHVDREAVPREPYEGHARLDRALEDLRELDPLLPQLELPPVDPGDIEEVIDEAHHVPELPLHHAIAWSMESLLPPASFMIWSALRIGASGLRSSWASVARNSSFLASASRSPS